MKKYFEKRIAAFKYAFSGIGWLFRNEAHALIHLCAAVGVIVAGFLFKISSLEWCVVCICIGMVFAAEAFNTAIEKLADKITVENDPLIKTAKDVAAGAVLFCAIASLIIAAVIFIPKL